MTGQVIEQAVAENSRSSEIAAEEHSVSTKSQTVNGTEQNSTGDNTANDAVTQAGSGQTVAEATTTVDNQDKAATSESDDEDENKKPKRKRRRKKLKKRRQLDTYQVGDELEGVVRSVQPYGAFIDVGAERDGLIHISELREGFVEKVEDVIKENDQVMVRVKEVNVETGRLSLTMRSAESLEAEKEPKKKRVHLRYLQEGQELVGRVNSLVDFGAFIDIGATTDGLVHISQMSNEHISSVSDFLKEGQEVNVRILSIDKKRKRISLTMREAQAEEEEPAEEPVEEPALEPAEEVVQQQVNQANFEEEEEEEETLSVMAMAFARAKARKNKGNKQSRKDNNKQSNSNLDDIIAKMLAQHRHEE